MQKLTEFAWIKCYLVEDIEVVHQFCNITKSTVAHLKHYSIPIVGYYFIQTNDLLHSLFTCQSQKPHLNTFPKLMFLIT